MNTATTEPEWMKRFITFDPLNELYTGWDESSAYVVIESKDRQEVIEKMIEYAKTL